MFSPIELQQPQVTSGEIAFPVGMSNELKKRGRPKKPMPEPKDYWYQLSSHLQKIVPRFNEEQLSKLRQTDAGSLEKMLEGLGNQIEEIDLAVYFPDNWKAIRFCASVLKDTLGYLDKDENNVHEIEFRDDTLIVLDALKFGPSKNIPIANLEDLFLLLIRGKEREYLQNKRKERIVPQTETNHYSGIIIYSRT